MQVLLIGLGKMGLNLSMNMMDHHHKVKAYDVNKASMEQARGAGIETYESIDALIASSKSPRIVWMMIPAGDITENMVNELSSKLEEGDILIDGGNSFYKDTLRRFEQLKEKGIHFVDVGTSGGMEGAREGACTMIGAEEEIFAIIEPLIRDISITDGYLHTGKPGSGHFLKMVHNGIEYGMMQAIGEGFEIMDKSPFDYQYEEVARVFNNGSVIRSWLMELMEHAFKEDAQLEKIRGVMHSSGEGQWTAEAALEFKAAAPIITMSQIMRDRSLEDDTFTGKVVAALRKEFGGHQPEYKQ